MNSSNEKRALPKPGKPLLPAVEPFAVKQPENPLPAATIDDLPPELQKACKSAGWDSLTPVQSMAIPYLLAGRDIMVQSRTGSGKTGCYLLPLLASLSSELKAPQALVLAPTRELAVQVEREAHTLFMGSGLAACAIYGGVGYREQLQAIRAGAQVIVGTPGRVIDLLLKKHLDFKNLRVLVFDEADRMLSFGFYPDITEIARHLPEKRQTELFSATYPPFVMRLAEEFMHNPEMLSLSRDELHVPEVDHLFVQVKPMDKDRALIRLLESDNPSSAIIFCNTKANVHYLTSVLQNFGYSADELTSDSPQKKREAVLAKLRNGTVKYLVATDVAARGIDIPNLSHVFLYESPNDHESYIHRAGRTGRAGAAGTVVSLVDVMERVELQRIAKHYKIKLREIGQPSDEDISKNLCARMNTILEGRLRDMSNVERMRLNRYLPLAREIAAMSGDDENRNIELIAMLLDDSHQAMLGGTRFPKPLPKPAPARPQRRSGAPKRKPFRPRAQHQDKKSAAGKA